ncbi:MAG TPA: tRNA (guanosine(37)-N1)-methyltransferase TrmD [Sneathiellales bacterium]|nr:tRNA (guanosine(37)-N1)-methyltransferase TrmD [Sneathiellales bacterium]
MAAPSFPLWTARVLTLFPDMFPGSLGQSLSGKALKNGIWGLETVDIRDFARDKHRSVDDAPFGGGAGLVMRPDVLTDAIEATVRRPLPDGTQVGDMPCLYLSPRGRLLTQARVRELAKAQCVTFVCGRYEGVDERALESSGVEEVSIGDYVLSGGEPAATVIIDSVVRLLLGVVGDPATLDEESFEEGLLEYPQYTRPREWRDREVPEVLLSGHHDRIKAWRRQQAERITEQRRPDLWSDYASGKNKGSAD